MSVFFGLACAFVWGAADFSGGIAAKRTNPYGAVIIAHGFSLLMLLTLVFLLHEPLPPLPDLLWGWVAGLGGGMGLVLLYTSLANGQMGIASPVSALVTASLPVLFGVFSEGLPRALTLAGFSLALAAVWLISGGRGFKLPLDKVLMPIASGIGFAIFLIFLDRGSGQSILWSLIATRLASIPSLLLVSRFTRQSWQPASDSWLPILLSSVLDSAGNALYAISARFGRMDVAAVLASLYPGSTVLLAWFLLKERLSPLQIFGIAITLAAIVLITI